MIHELDTVVLTTDLPECGLVEGDVGAVVMMHSGGVGFEVEFVTLGGETVSVVSLNPSQVRAIGRREIPHVRTMDA